MIRGLKATAVLFTLTALILALVPAAYAQTSYMAGTYYRTFQTASGSGSATMELRPDGTAIVTNNYANGVVVTQTGTWTWRPSYTLPDRTFVTVNLTSSNGTPINERLSFNRTGNQLYGLSFDRTVYGCYLYFTQTRFEPIGRGPSTATLVTGTIAYSERMALTPNAVVRVRLVDLSCPGTVISEQVISNPGQVPISFSLPYNPLQIVPGHTYAVQASIMDNGQMLFRTTQNYPVITQGNPTNLNVMLVHI